MRVGYSTLLVFVYPNVINYKIEFTNRIASTPIVWILISSIQLHPLFVYFLGFVA